MTAFSVLPVDLQDRLSDLEDLVTGLHALTSLLAEVDGMVVKPNELFQLINPIVEQQKQVLDTIIFGNWSN